MREGETLEVCCRFCAERYTVDAGRARAHARGAGVIAAEPHVQVPRALCVAHVTGETGFSGGEVQLFLLLEGLRARGERVLLVCPPGSRAEVEARRRGFETHGVAMRSDASALAVLRIRRLLRDTQPDLVHLHSGRANWLGGLAAWSLGLPALTTRRMDREVRRGPRTRLLYGRITRRAVAISPAVEACLLAGGVEPARIRVIPSAVDAARARRAARARDDTPRRGRRRRRRLRARAGCTGAPQGHRRAARRAGASRVARRPARALDRGRPPASGRAIRTSARSPIRNARTCQSSVVAGSTPKYAAHCGTALSNTAGSASTSGPLGKSV